DLRALGPGRRGHLGDARRPTGLRLLAPDVLGRDRARGTDGPPARPARRHRALDGGARPDLRAGPGPRLAPGAPPVRPALRHGRLNDARLAFEKMQTYANHLGLYSEEIGPTGEQLGNFPQAFTHLALISAAVNLDRQLG